MKVHKQTINLTDFIKARLEFFNTLAIQSNLSFIFESKSTESTININETKLQRIIDNNLTNAIKYTHENEPIKIVLDDFIFTISSKSRHIQQPQKVFEAYYREADTKSGLGLGLSLVKQICKEEGIKIELRSDENLTSFSYDFKEVSI
jgi:signal transduction histidine kinase